MSFRINNIVFTLHNLIGILVLLAGLASFLGQYSGNSIVCKSGDNFPTSYVNNFCLESTGFVKSFERSYSGRDRSDERGISLRSYKLAPLRLTVLSLPFLLVTLLWFYMSDSPLKLEKDEVVDNFDIQDLLGKGWRAGIKHILKNLLLLLNVFLIFQAMPFKHTYSDYFPGQVGCTLSGYTASGAIAKFDAHCLLPLNVYYFQFFVVLILVLRVFAVLSALNFIYALLSTLPCIPSVLVRFVDPQYKSYKLIRIASECSFGDWILIKNLMENTDPASFKLLQRGEEFSKLIKN